MSLAITGPIPLNELLHGEAQGDKSRVSQNGVMQEQAIIVWILHITQIELTPMKTGHCGILKGIECFIGGIYRLLISPLN